MAGLNFHNKFKEVKTTFFLRKIIKKINIKWYFMRALLNVNHKYVAMHLDELQLTSDCTSYQIMLA